MFSDKLLISAITLRSVSIIMFILFIVLQTLRSPQLRPDNWNYQVLGVRNCL